jgi:hypothetical protein
MNDDHTPAEIEAEDAATFRAALAHANAEENRLYNERVREEDAALRRAYSQGNRREWERIIARRWWGRG